MGATPVKEALVYDDDKLGKVVNLYVELCSS